jgi:hypothetical protein
MPRLDLIHTQVKNALVNDGWEITDDPYNIVYGSVRLQADLGAQKSFAAERNGTKIVVEVKSFTGKSLIHEVENAVGQYLLYVRYMRLSDDPHILYLALSHEVYERFGEIDGLDTVLEQLSVSLLVVDVTKEEVVKWIR